MRDRRVEGGRGEKKRRWGVACAAPGYGEVGQNLGTHEDIVEKFGTWMGSLEFKLGARGVPTGVRGVPGVSEHCEVTPGACAAPNLAPGSEVGSEFKGRAPQAPLHTPFQIDPSR